MAPRITRADSRLPRYQQLRDTFAAKITERVWRPGDQLPSELELAKEYSVSLGTVRRAIELLVDGGLLERAQGKGTFVRRASFDTSLFRFFRFQGTGGERPVPGSRLLRREVIEAPSEVSRNLRLRKGEAAIHFLRQRLDGDAPFMVEDIWLPERLFRALVDLPLEDFGDLLYPLYEVKCGQLVATAEETLTAEAVDSLHAKWLGVNPGTPIVVIERLVFGYDQRPLEWRRTRGRADKFQYHIKIN